MLLTSKYLLKIATGWVAYCESSFSKYTIFMTHNSPISILYDILAINTPIHEREFKRRAQNLELPVDMFVVLGYMYL